MAMQSPDVAASSPPPDKSTRPGSGGPPRWLVVVLVLLIPIVSGLWIQRRSKPLTAAPGPVIQPLAVERIMPLAAEGQVPILVTEESLLAHDPSTDRLWMVVRNGSGWGDGALEVRSTTPGCAAFAPTVEVQTLLPDLRKMQFALAFAPGGHLYLAYWGNTKEQVPALGILRSTDDGITWERWYEHRDNGWVADESGYRLVTWKSDLALIYKGQKEKWQNSYIVEVIDADGDTSPPIELSPALSMERQGLLGVLATESDLHVIIRTSAMGNTLHVLALRLDSRLQLSPSQELPQLNSRDVFEVAIVEDVAGDPLLVLNYEYDEPPPPPKRAARRDAARRLKSDPSAFYPVASLWGWDVPSAKWTPHDIQPAPRIRYGLLPRGNGFVLSEWSDHAEDRGWLIDRVSTTAGWTDRWNLQWPENTHYVTLDAIQLSDGRLAWLGKRGVPAKRQDELVLIVTAPMPLAGAASPPLGSTR